MDTRYLEYILVLAETGNMTRAASKLFISQPTLSQFLAKQEQEIGTPLFLRTGGVYTLTPVGELYADYARKVLSLTDILNKDIQRISTASRLSIGTSASRALEMLTSILGDFRKYYPNVQLVLSDNNLNAMRNSISKGDVDIAFVTANSLEPYKGNSMELKKEEVVFAAPNSHPYCQSLKDTDRLSLTGRELLRCFGETPFILQLKGSCIRYLVDDFLRKGLQSYHCLQHQPCPVHLRHGIQQHRSCFYPQRLRCQLTEDHLFFPGTENVPDSFHSLSQGSDHGTSPQIIWWSWQRNMRGRIGGSYEKSS